jgi:hypothetical protein
VDEEVGARAVRRAVGNVAGARERDGELAREPRFIFDDQDAQDTPPRVPYSAFDAERGLNGAFICRSASAL